MAHHWISYLWMIAHSTEAPVEIGEKDMYYGYLKCKGRYMKTLDFQM